MRAIVEADRQLVLERGEVAHVDRGMDHRQPLALEHASQQRLARRPRLGRVDAEPMEHATRLGHAGNVGGGAPGGAAQQLTEGGVALALERVPERLAVQPVGFEPAQRDDAPQGVVHLERETTSLERH
ncbi:MAG TPA: hypothetical protein VMS45_05700 [Gemmatimonadaceae bacterium]|nr:hypothetical protein [Gemmatimonadaceae bacterium]